MGSERLIEVLDRIRDAANRRSLPLVVFDLDSTLFATAWRNLDIVREYAATMGDPGLLDIAASISIDDLGWNPRDPIVERGADPALLEQFGAFWKDRFFTDEYCVRDRPNPGAVEYVRAAHDRGALVYYLTGRHVGGMEQGTIAALRDHGFPLFRGRTILHLKPSFTMPDKMYKQMAVEDIRSHHAQVVATFDNEPENCNLFQTAFPQAVNFWVDTEHSPTPEPLRPELVHTEDFRLPVPGD